MVLHMLVWYRVVAGEKLNEVTVTDYALLLQEWQHKPIYALVDVFQNFLWENNSALKVYQDYSFHAVSFSYSSSDSQEVSMNVNRTGNKKQGGTFKCNSMTEITPNQMRYLYLVKLVLF